MSNQKTIKQANRNTILAHIRRHGPISRWAIAQQLDLSASAVSSSVADLIARDVIHEKGTGASSGGRKPIMLDINPRGGLVIAVDIQSVSRQRGVYTAAVDLKGRVFKQARRDITYTDNASFLLAVEDAIQNLMRDADVELQSAISIGIAAPGLINNATGEIVMHGRRIRNLALAASIQQRFGCPVVVHNQNDAAAYGEYHFGIAQGYQRVLYIRVGYGVGAGFVIDGEIYHNAPISAGEIGHVTVLPDGPVCRCGNRGCLSVLVSSPIIVERVRDAMQQSGADDAALEALTLPHILQAAEQGDPLCEPIMREVAEWIGIVVANSINLLAPEIVVLSSELFDTSPDILTWVTEVVERRALDIYLQHTTLVPSQLREDAGLRGIGVLALNNLLTI